MSFERHLQIAFADIKGFCQAFYAGGMTQKNLPDGSVHQPIGSAESIQAKQSLSKILVHTAYKMRKVRPCQHPIHDPVEPGGQQLPRINRLISKIVNRLPSKKGKTMRIEFNAKKCLPAVSNNVVGSCHLPNQFH